MNTSEETKDYWTRGDLNGKWYPSVDDMNTIYDVSNFKSDELDQYRNGVDAKDMMYAFYYTRQEMTLPMLSPDSLYFNLKHRQKCYEKMLNTEWDDALLNAFANFQFACYMADVEPEFGKRIQIDVARDIPFSPSIRLSYNTGILGQKIFLLKMLFETAGEVLGDEFRNGKDECRISALYYNLDNQSTMNTIGIEIHVVSCCVAYLWLDFEPVYDKEKTKYGCKYKIEAVLESWSGRRLPLTGKNKPSTPYVDLLMKLRTEVTKKMRVFSKKLDEARFNNPAFRPDDMK